MECFVFTKHIKGTQATEIFSYFSGLRKVYPYLFKYSTHAKGRWLGKRIPDIIAKEFYRGSVSMGVSIRSNIYLKYAFLLGAKKK